MKMLFVLFIPLLLHCTGSLDGSSRASRNRASGAAWLEQLNTRDDYNQMVYSSAGYSFVKYTYEIADTGQTVYFQNTSQYEYHHPFLATEIEKYKGISSDTLYNELMTKPCKEGLALGAIYYSDTVTVPGAAESGALGFTVFFNSFDECRIAATFERMKVAAPFANSRVGFIFERNEDYFKYAKKLEAGGIPVFRAKQFFETGDNNKTYHNALSYGFLKRLDDAAMAAGDYSSKDILVLKNVPRDIGPVAGIITEEMQVPSSHVVLRCMNQNVPDMRIVNATSNSTIQKNLGKLVQFEALEDGTFTIKNAEDLGQQQLKQLAEDYWVQIVPVHE